MGTTRFNVLVISICIFGFRGMYLWKVITTVSESFVILRVSCEQMHAKNSSSFLNEFKNENKLWKNVSAWFRLFSLLYYHIYIIFWFDSISFYMQQFSQNTQTTDCSWILCTCGSVPSLYFWKSISELLVKMTSS